MSQYRYSLPEVLKAVRKARADGMTLHATRRNLFFGPRKSLSRGIIDRAMYVRSLIDFQGILDLVYGVTDHASRHLAAFVGATTQGHHQEPGGVP